MVTAHDEQSPKDSSSESTETTRQEVAFTDVAATNTSDERTVINPWSRLIAVITDPAAAMRGVAQKGSWGVPLIVFILAIGFFALIAGDIVAEFAVEQSRERFDEMIQSGQMTQQQVDQAMRMQSGGMMKIFMFVNPLLATFFIKLILATLFLLGGNVIFGGNAKFGQYWAVLWYASVIGAISMVIGSVLINVTGDMQGAQLGLGILTKGDPTSTAHKIASVFSVFTIWEAIVAGIGLGILAKLSQGKGIAWALICYLGFGLLTSLLSGQSWV